MGGTSWALLYVINMKITVDVICDEMCRQLDNSQIECVCSLSARDLGYKYIYGLGTQELSVPNILYMANRQLPCCRFR